MYSHHLSAMADQLIDAGLLETEDKQRAVNAMAKTWTDQIAVSWCIGDVHSVAKNMGLTLTDDQAREVLDAILEDHDASLGINWTGIETHLMQHDFESAS